MRKKLLLSAVFVFISCMSICAITPETTVAGNWPDLIPAEWSKDGKSFVCYYDDHDLNGHFTIYDENFQLYKEINVPQIEYTSTYSIQTRAYCFKVELNGSEYETGEIININGETTGLTIERVQSYLYALNGKNPEIANLPNGTQALVCEYFEPDNYGDMYPLYYYREINGEWKECCQSYYAYGSMGYYGKWLDPKETTVVNGTSIGVVRYFNDADEYDLTRGLFSEDFNYVITKYEQRSFEEVEMNGNGEIGYKAWGTRYEMSGFNVCDDSGKILMTFDIPSEYHYDGYDDDIYLFTLGPNKFVAIPVRDADRNDFNLVYRIDSNNSVSFVTAAPTSKVSPRNPKRGENVTVSLDSSVGEGAMVHVVSASGQTMLNTKIPVGQTQLDINTSGFNQGVYVVTVMSNGTSKEAAKIIVR